jgi:hypothetical protein
VKEGTGSYAPGLMALLVLALCGAAVGMLLKERRRPAAAIPS